MKYFNTIRGVIQSIIFIVFVALANVASASQHDEIFAVQSCNDLRNGIEAVARKANNQKTDISDLKFNYIDALECNAAVLDKNIFTKVNYIFFSDAAIYSNELALTILKAAFQFEDVRIGTITENFKEKMSMQKVKPESSIVSTTSAVSEIMMVVSIAALVIFFVYYIYNSAYEGVSFGSSASFAWIAARVGITIILIVPLDSIGGFAAIQVIVLSIAVFGNLLANVVAFMLPLFEYLDAPDMEKVEFDNSPDFYTSVSNAVDVSIETHLCDIAERKHILMEKFRKDEDRRYVEQDPFYKCLNEKEILDDANGSFFESKHLKRTRICAKDTKEVDLYVNCSDHKINRNYEDERDNLFINLIIANDDKFREIAFDVNKEYCSQQMDYNYKNAREYGSKCATFNGTQLEFETKGNKEVVKMMEKADDNLKKSIESKTSAIKLDIYRKLVNNNKDIVRGGYIDEKADSLKEKIGESIMKGWLGAATFMFSSGQQIKSINQLYIKNLSSVNLSVGRGGAAMMKDPSLSAGNNTTASRLIDYKSRYFDFNDIYLTSTEETKEEMFYKLIDKDTVGYINESNEASVMMRLFFPAILKVKGMSGGEVLNSSSKESCLMDFSNCHQVGVNPIKDVVEMGSEMLSTGSSVTIGIVGVKAVYNAIYKNGTDSKMIAFGLEITTLLQSLFLFYTLLGAVLTYLPIVLIFAYFIGNAIGWISNVLIFTTISILWVVMHFFPENGKGFAGKASYGYKRLLDILLRPTFIVFGVFVTYIITSIMLALLNIMFAIVINTFELFNAPNTMMDFIMNYIAYVIYVVLVIIVLWRSIKSIYKVPNALMDWFNLENDDGQEVFNEITNYFTLSVSKAVLGDK